MDWAFCVVHHLDLLDNILVICRETVGWTRQLPGSG